MKKIIFVLLLNLCWISTLYANIPQNAFWNNDKTFAVVSNPKQKGTTLTLYRVNEGRAEQTDLSYVEGQNIGKLGNHPKEYYDRIETKPIEWMQTGNDSKIVRIQTQAWKSGRRFTVSEPVLIQSDGNVLLR